MANNGTYGTKKPALITNTDVDIFYFYRPTRSTDSPDFSSGFKTLDRSILSTTQCNGSVLPGMYNLKLPLSEFGSPGIYTVYIKPREITATILDISVLAAAPGVRGIVLDSSTIITDDTTIFNNGNLVGYRIDYYDGSNTQLDMYRIITSNNRCEPVAQNLNNVNSSGIKYRFNNSSNLIFCTVTPSAALSFKPNEIPAIGMNGQTIKLVNTKFNPISLELEIVDHDIENVVTMLEGDQIRNLDNALITTFNKDGEIYHQAEYGNIIDTASGTHTDFKFMKDNTSIVTSEKNKKDDIKKQL